MKPKMNKKVVPRGFTFIEVMVATCVLALGTVLFYEAFFANLDLFNYCKDSLEVALWMDERLWEASYQLRQGATLPKGDLEGEFFKRNKRFSWQLSAQSSGEVQDAYTLCSLDLKVSWNAGRRSVSLMRNADILIKKQGS